MLGSALPGFAAEPQPGRSKVAIRYLFTMPDASAPASLLSSVGGTVLEEYESMLLGSIPSGRARDFQSLAEALRFDAEVRDEFDVIRLPLGSLDVRRGIAGSFPGRLPSVPYAPGLAGVYLVQFIGPILPEWHTAIRAAGMMAVQYLSNNAFIVAGTPEAAIAVRQLRFVQFIDGMPSFLKPQPPPSPPGSSTDAIVQVANAIGADEAVGKIRALSTSPPKVELWSAAELQVTGTFDAATIAHIVEFPLVFGVAAVPTIGLSDERPATSLTRHVTGGQPGNAGGYKNWLAAACPYCTALQSDGFWVGVADTGLSGGDASGATYHQDLPQVRIKWGENFNIANSTFADTRGHGTMVAGVLGGNPYDVANAEKDSDNFYYGTGVAPSVGIFVTKIREGSTSTTDPTTPIRDLTNDALKQSPPVVIQSHSYNEYAREPDACYDGTYSMLSRDFDKAVIDGQSGVTGNQPVTLVVSAGNQGDSQHQNNCNPNIYNVSYVLPPATAKNVISAGMAETVRTANWNCMGCGSSSFDNIAYDSRRGTKTSGWYKPDLYVPSANVSSAKSPSWNSGYPQCTGGSAPNLVQYLANSGTSFAAPAIAGAAILARRVYSEHLSPNCSPNCSAAAASPALVKAMLIAATRSMAEGTSYSRCGSGGCVTSPAPVSPIGGYPNDLQGFGRTHLEDLFSIYPAHYYHDQAHPFTTGSPDWTKALTIHDPALPVRLVLTWTDKPALQDSSPSTATENDPLSNDLDLSVEVVTGETCTKRFIGNKLTWSSGSTEESTLYDPCTAGSTVFDRRNNVEVIRFIPGSSNTTTTFRVRVHFDRSSLLTGEEQRFALVAYNAYDLDAPPPSLPTVTAQATSTTAVSVSWASSSGATSYEVQRQSGSGWATIGTTTSTSYLDNDRAPDTAYLYRVRARKPTVASAWSAPDVATTVLLDGTFAQAQKVHADHLFRLRKGVNALRVLAGLSAPTYTDPATTSAGLAGVVIRRAHILELRSNGDEARGNLGLAPMGYGETITAGQTIVKFSHFDEIWKAFQ